MKIGTWSIDDMRGKKYDPVDLALAPSPMCFKMLASHKLLHKKKNPSVFTKKFRQQIRATSLHTQESVRVRERQGKDYYVLLKRDNKPLRMSKCRPR